jgi:hypothetical protein
MKYSLKFNWFEIIFYSFFITYGYFGLMTKIGPDKNLSQFLVSTLVLTAIQILFGYLSSSKFTFADDEISFEKNDLYKFLGLFSVLILITLPQLNWALYMDELSYTGAAHLHSIQGLLAIGSRLSFLSNVPFQYVAQLISFILLLGLIIVFWISQKLDWKLRSVFLAVLFLGCRLAIYFMGGNGSPHPSFELVMPFIFGAVFGLNHIALKLSYLFGSAVFLFFIYKRIQDRFSESVAYFSVFAIGTLPLFLHMSTIADHSLWAGLAISYVLVELLFNVKAPYFRLICVISIATMMRQPCFIALVPVLAHYVISQFRQVKAKEIIKNLALWNLPTLFFIPFVGKSVIYGTPSTQGVAVGSTLVKLQWALKTPIVLVSAANSVNIWWLALIPFVFITWKEELKTSSLCFRFFAIAAFVVFYSIHPSLWGHAKYQFEFIVPLAVAGLLMLMISLPQNKIFRAVMSLILLVIGSLNIYTYMNYQKGNISVDKLVTLTGELNKSYNAGYRGLVTLPFNYKEAFADIKTLNVASGTFVVGGSYGVVQEILGGYTLSETLAANQIYKDQQNQIVQISEDNSVIFDAERAQADLRITALLLGPIPQDLKTEAMLKMQNLGWKLYKTYSNTEYGSTLTLMLR